MMHYANEGWQDRVGDPVFTQALSCSVLLLCNNKIQYSSAEIVNTQK